MTESPPWCIGSKMVRHFGAGRRRLEIRREAAQPGRFQHPVPVTKNKTIQGIVSSLDIVKQVVSQNP